MQFYQQVDSSFNEAYFAEILENSRKRDLWTGAKVLVVIGLVLLTLIVTVIHLYTKKKRAKSKKRN